VVVIARGPFARRPSYYVKSIVYTPFAKPYKQLIVWFIVVKTFRWPGASLDGREECSKGFSRERKNGETSTIGFLHDFVRLLPYIVTYCARLYEARDESGPPSLPFSIVDRSKFYRRLSVRRAIDDKTRWPRAVRASRRRFPTVFQTTRSEFSWVFRRRVFILYACKSSY